MAFDYHAQHNNVESATALSEAHNNYVQQLHAANGMIDQYYKETLPQLLQVRADMVKTKHTVPELSIRIYSMNQHLCIFFSKLKRFFFHRNWTMSIMMSVQ